MTSAPLPERLSRAVRTRAAVRAGLVAVLSAGEPGGTASGRTGPDPSLAGEAGWEPMTAPGAAQLRRAWFRRSVETCWAAADDWWDPACDAVVDAVRSGRDVRPCVRRLGRARARLGVTVDETMGDVVALWEAHARREPPFRVLRAVVAGWAEVGLEPAGAASCFDAITGLSTRAHLEARLGELYRAGALGGQARRYQLVVLDVGVVVPGSTAPDEVAWRQVEALYRCAEAVRRVFSSGETLSRLAPARVGALAESGPDLGRKLGALDGLLAAGASPDVSPAVWVEALPRTYGLVPQLLADLSR